MPQYAKGIRFLPADSLAGRRMQAAKGTGDLGSATESKDPAVRAHNAAIEERRQAKLEARKARREGKRG